MKKLLIALIGMVMIFECVAQNDWAQFNRYAEANRTAKRGAKALFMGNSITDGWINQSPEFFNDNDYIDRGIGGQVTAQMLARFRADVIDLQPRAVVILAGINDIAQNNGVVAVENIFDNIVSMSEIAKANGIKVILCSVLPAARFPWRQEINPVEQVSQLNALLAEYAKHNKIPYVDYFSAMANDDRGLSKELAHDGIHPTKAGYTIMEGIVKPIIDKHVK